MQTTNEAVPIPSGFRPFMVTAAGCHWFVRYEHDAKGNIIGREFAMYADVQPILDANGQKARTNDGWSTDKDKFLRRAASVPFALINKWKIEEGWDYLSADPDMQKKARQKLNDREFYKLRTADWNV